MADTIRRDVVTVAGPDARSYLHGQVSQDVTALAPGMSTWTLVLAPNGRVEALARIHCVADDRFELDVEPGHGEALLARLQRFLIRVKAEISFDARDLDASQLVGWWGSGTQYAGPDAESRRIAAGWPAMGAEIVAGERIPAETGVVDVAVSFTKGCYPGQELVERMHSRGAQAPRQLRILTRDEAEESGAEVTSATGDTVLGYVGRGVDVGTVPGPTSA